MLATNKRLTQLYTQGHSNDEIAKIVGYRNGKTVGVLLSQRGITKKRKNRLAAAAARGRLNAGYVTLVTERVRITGRSVRQYKLYH
jgi:transposase